MAKATWTAGVPTISKDAAGTLTASVPLKNSGVLAATITFRITADRALRIDVTNEPGAAGLSDFSAWSREGS